VVNHVCSWVLHYVLVSKMRRLGVQSICDSQLLRVVLAAHDGSKEAKPHKMCHSSTESTLSVCSTLHCTPVLALQMHRQLPQHHFVKNMCCACLPCQNQVAAANLAARACRSQ
jgi:hypothetical protein